MSWQLTSFVILAVVLLGGFAWYERSRPPSQVVALVAALAALAIAGRIAFAAFPNVKPTTDIVVFAGYALGPAPGFAVGALAGLVSNFWFGQGPWTPWQMAGWGMCGVMGAGAGAGGPQRRSPQPRRGLRTGGHRLRCVVELLAHGDLRRRSLTRALPHPGGARDSLRRRPRRRQRRLRPARRPGDGADAGPLPPALPVAHARRRDGDPGHPAASQPAAGNGQGGRHRRGGELARSGAEHRRRLRLLALIGLRAPRSPAGRCSASRRPGAIPST